MMRSIKTVISGKPGKVGHEMVRSWHFQKMEKMRKAIKERYLYEASLMRNLKENDVFL